MTDTKPDVAETATAPDKQVTQLLYVAENIQNRGDLKVGPHTILEVLISAASRIEALMRHVKIIEGRLEFYREKYPQDRARAQSEKR